MANDINPQLFMEVTQIFLFNGKVRQIENKGLWLITPFLERY